MKNANGRRERAVARFIFESGLLQDGRFTVKGFCLSGTWSNYEEGIKGYNVMRPARYTFIV